MKLNLRIKNLFIILLITINCYIFTNTNLSKNKLNLKVKQTLNITEKFKFYFLLKLPSVKNDLTHPLNILSYKNVLLSTSQMVFFLSQNPEGSVKLF